MDAEVLLISVRDVPLSDLMARIATVTSGKWRHEGTTYRLIADPAQRQREERKQQAERLALVRKVISDRVAASLQGQKENAKEFATASKGGAQQDDQALANRAALSDPEAGLFESLLQTLDPSVLSEMEPGDRVVFSTDANAMQRDMGTDAAGIINDFVERHNTWVSTLTPE